MEVRYYVYKLTSLSRSQLMSGESIQILKYFEYTTIQICSTNPLIRKAIYVLLQLHISTWTCIKKSLETYHSKIQTLSLAKLHEILSWRQSIDAYQNMNFRMPQYSFLIYIYTFEFIYSLQCSCQRLKVGSVETINQ